MWTTNINNVCKGWVVWHLMSLSMWILHGRPNEFWQRKCLCQNPLFTMNIPWQDPLPRDLYLISSLAPYEPINVNPVGKAQWILTEKMPLSESPLYYEHSLAGTPTKRSIFLSFIMLECYFKMMLTELLLSESYVCSVECMSESWGWPWGRAVYCLDFFIPIPILIP